MYCKQCQYDLHGLAHPCCPECGGVFDPADARTFDAEPAWRLSAVGVAAAIAWVLVLVSVPVLYGGWGVAGLNRGVPGGVFIAFGLLAACLGVGIVALQRGSGWDKILGAVATASSMILAVFVLKDLA